MKMITIGAGVLALIIAGCAEPQIAPVIQEHSSSEFTVQTIADGLNAPWSVAALPDGSYLVTEKTGSLKRISVDGSAQDVTGLPEDIYVDQQGGLLEIALVPDYGISQTVYLSYATGDKKANRTALYKARFNGGALVGGQQIFMANPAKDTGSHFGGRIAFLPDGSLILSLGEGFAYREAAQDKSSHLGKVLRLNTDGSAASGNPFSGDAKAAPEVYTYGHRNVQGLHYDTQSGVLWAHEHGPKGGDELNILKPGANYGWPLTTTGVDYNGAKITPHKTYPGTEGFVKDWVPSIAPSGLTIYRGDMFPEWNGDAFVGGLKSRDVRRIDLENGKFVGEESLLADLGARIRDVRTAPDGALLILTDDAENGKLLRVTPKQ